MKLACTIAFLLVFVGIGMVWGQDEEARKHFLHELGGPFFISRDAVQEELKLTDEQKQKLREAMTGYVQDAMKINDLNGTDQEQAMTALRQTSYEQFERSLNNILTAEQLKRFIQLKLQYDTPATMLQPEIVKELNLSDEQRGRFMGIIQEMQQKMNPLISESQSGGNPQEILSEVIKMRLDSQSNIEALLTEPQRKQWQEMIGKPFVIWRYN